MKPILTLKVVLSFGVMIALAAAAAVGGLLALQAGQSAGLPILVLSGVAMVVGSVAAAVIGRDLSRATRTLGVALNRLADGDTDIDIALPPGRHDELGVMAAATRRLRDTAVIDRRTARAVDAVNGNIMITDSDLKIVYANPAVLRTLAAAEADIRKELPHFSAANVIGNSIDIFHRNPGHQRRILENLSGNHLAKIKVGGRAKTDFHSGDKQGITA